MKDVRVIVPMALSPKPTDREMAIAYVMAEFFQKDVYFVVRAGHRTADYFIDRRYWELKSPTGDGKRTIQHALQKAARQSENVIIDLYWLKMGYTRAINRIAYEAKFIPKIKRLVVVSRTGKVLVIK